MKKKIIAVLILITALFVGGYTCADPSQSVQAEEAGCDYTEQTEDPEVIKITEDIGKK